MYFDTKKLDRVAKLCYSVKNERVRIMRSTYARPVRDLRNNYNEIISLANEGNQIIITQNGREAAVVIGTEAYKDYESFLYKQYINHELALTKEKSKDKDTQWIDENDFWEDHEDIL